MSYTVEYTERALKSLKRLDHSALIIIKAWIEKNIMGTEDPRRRGKGQTANRSGNWRYRVGDYRILAEIQDEVLVILIIDIGHRSTIYTG